MWKGDIRLIALHACGLQPYYYHDVRGDVTMQKSQRITTSCDLWDNFPESNSKPRVDVGLKSNFCDSSHFFFLWPNDASDKQPIKYSFCFSSVEKPK